MFFRSLSRYWSVIGRNYSQFIPKHTSPSDLQIEQLQNFIDTKNNIFVLSGAGLSTESGLPDYRSKDVGLYDRSNHKPIQHHQFVSSEFHRKRYWARNYSGWDLYEQFNPNSAYVWLKELEDSGKVICHVTQNVDGLARKAGIENLIELHGSMYQVKCLDCDDVTSRHQFQKRLKLQNKDWKCEILDWRPDADVDVSDEDCLKFQVPPCGVCGGRLKPNVVFFGDTVDRNLVEDLYHKIELSDGLLVCGSSLYVWSGYRFVRHAREHQVPIFIINIGETRADSICTFKIQSSITQTLNQIYI